MPLNQTHITTLQTVAAGQTELLPRNKLVRAFKAAGAQVAAHGGRLIVSYDGINVPFAGGGGGDMAVRAGTTYCTVLGEMAQKLLSKNL